MTLHPKQPLNFAQPLSATTEREAGLGDRFVNAVEAGFRQIGRNPFTWRRIRGHIRRYLVKTFPYGIVYAVVEGEILILAVMHLKREPDYWLGRLSDLPSPPGS